MFPAMNIMIAMIRSRVIGICFLSCRKVTDNKPHTPYRHYRLMYQNYGFAPTAPRRQPDGNKKAPRANDRRGGADIINKCM